MCGILGWAGPALDESTWAYALGRLAHRGPDGYGTHHASPEQTQGLGDLWLGHRRLAILDLSEAAAQPIRAPRSGVVLSFNGQIYNFRELKEELRDYPYQGHGDTEVLLAALEAWGIEAIPRLRGMFAFAWWDPRTQQLGLARDRMGVKPLYYRLDDQGLAFGSECRALNRLAGQAGTLSTQGLASFLTWGSVGEPGTIWEGVHALPPGTLALWDGQQLKRSSYWDSLAVLHHPPGRPEEVQGRIAEAVRLRLVSDAPLGIFLSSGLDSAVLACESAAAGLAPRALTLAFPEDPFNEAEGAAEVARHLGLEHQVVHFPMASVPGLFDQFVQDQDQPSLDGLNTWLIAKAAREAGFKVMLSGVGGDELFFGYQSFERVRKGWARPRPWLGRLLKAYRGPASGKVNRLASLLSARTQADAFPWFRALWDARALEALGLPLGQLFPPLPTENLWGVSPENQLSWYELTHYLRHTLLRDGDVMSMAHHIELRTPFMDHPLIEHVLPMSADAKWGPSNSPKYLLRAAYRSRLPESLFTRPKQGFGLPYAHWMAHTLAPRWRDAKADLLASHLIPAGLLTELERMPNPWMRQYQLLILHTWWRNSLSPSPSDPT